jgi:beta-galactosidase
MAALMDNAGIKSPFDVPRGVELCVRKSGSAQWLFLLNHTASAQTVTHPGQFKELLTGATSTGKLTLDAYDVRVLQPL